MWNQIRCFFGENHNKNTERHKKKKKKQPKKKKKKKKKKKIIIIKKKIRTTNTEIDIRKADLIFNLKWAEE